MAKGCSDVMSQILLFCKLPWLLAAGCWLQLWLLELMLPQACPSFLLTYRATS